MIASIVLGSGCFWCSEASYQKIIGVVDVTSGYADGIGNQPNYESVSSGKSGYAEVVKVAYDDELITLKEILDIFWIIHDPTSLNRQGNDIGTQYRSTILYHSTAEKKIIHQSLKGVSQQFADPIVTIVKKLETFFPAEDYHKNYFRNHPDQAYCQFVICPKLTKLRQKMSHHFTA